ncbi:hypothetical protein [Helicobacter pylori]|nr:hypothetical protein [Helicobacter pylori]
MSSTSQNTLESIWLNFQQLDFLKSSNQLEALIKMQEIPLN